MIKYIGSKRVLVPHIVRGVAAFPESGRVLDLFSGTSRVAHGLKASGRYVIANDHLTYAATLARCYVQADAKRWLDEARPLIEMLGRVKPKAGYFTKTFCQDARYLQPHNGARVDAIREEIARLGLSPELEAIALVSLMEGADRVDSTTGLQMAYLKKWATRSFNDLELRVPAILPGSGLALQLDAAEAATRDDVDVVYIDPPYNQHSYMGNYHVWESLVRWDKPETYGVANKRVQCKEYKSDFNSKKRIRHGLATLIDAVRCGHLVVSFNNEGYVDRDEMVGLLSSKGHVGVVGVDFKRYVGAQIGIHNLDGEKVGRVSHLRNTEYLFVVSERRETVERVVQALERSIGAEALARGSQKSKREAHESERRIER